LKGSEKKSEVTLKGGANKALSPENVDILLQNDGLQKLSMVSNGIISIPPALFSAPSLFLNTLKELKLDENKLTELSPSIGNLSALEKLSARRNCLTSFPAELCNLTNLTVLILSENKLRDLPPQIGGLQNLRKLDIQKNQLSLLPPELSKLVNLRELSGLDNPLESPTTDILLEGLQPVMDYLAKKLKHQELAIENAKDKDSKEKQKQQKHDKRQQLLELLKDDVGRDAFRSFLNSEHCEENLQFYDAVVKFEYMSSITTSHEIVVKDAWRIYETFVKVEAVNVPANLLEAMNALFQNAKTDPSLINNTTFRATKKHILSLLANDCLVRFLRSAQYKEYVKTRPDDIWTRRNKALGLI